MPWNWELPDWPHFHYDPALILQKEKQFLLNTGAAVGVIKNIHEKEYQQFVVEILSEEGLESSRIEGEILDRESLQSSIQKHFGIKASRKQDENKESRMAGLLCDVYSTYDEPLTHEMLCQWHYKLFHHQKDVIDCGKYRTHLDPMQIVSHRYDTPKVFFEAPPSKRIPKEMDAFINWFNLSTSEPILGRAAIAHLYFENIHPFEDGNGRIGRILVEKILSHGVGRPVLIAVSKVLETRKKEYYAALERCNHTLDAVQWVEFFTDAVLQAQKESISFLYFLIEKAKMITSFKEKLNARQEKVLLRMFAEGISGFKGGLSAEKYISITKASRSTATRDLVELVQMGALVRKGELRHTRYWLNLPDELIFNEK